MTRLNVFTLSLFLLLIGFKSYSQTPNDRSQYGQWGEVIEFDLVPVAIANLPDGRLVTWSSKYHDHFDMNEGYTFTQIFDPSGNGNLGSVLPRTVTETYHDMFCPGINNLADGRLLVTGGSSDERTSIYDPKTGIWTADENMKIARGYQGAVTLSDGRAFTIGGSWNDGVPEGDRDGEIWTEGEGWKHLTGLPGDMLYNQRDSIGEPEEVYRLDNHAWLFAAPNGKIFHAGPGETMNWIEVDGNNGIGSYSPFGQRDQDTMSMNGGAAMFDIGKILKVGGSASYTSMTWGNSNAYVIELDPTGDTDDVRVIPTGPVQHARVYVSTVVLPNGEVLVMGGLDHAEVFVDEVAYLSAEMYRPSDNSFRPLASMQVPRTYHSAAILLKDGRVFMGGGGLCGETCDTNHKDAEIYSPPYLFNADGELADRPTLNAPDNAFYGKQLTVTTSAPIQEFSFLRMSSATHSINNEQRRVPVDFALGANGDYVLEVPEANVMPPGYYMLFAMDANGVPSIAETVLVGEADSRLNGENLLVELDFIEGIGSLIRDSSGNNNHGQIIERTNSGADVNPPSHFWTADGLSGNALEMDGMEFNSNSIVEISKSPDIGAALTNEITVMAWVNRNLDSRLPDGKIPNVAIFTHLGELSSGYSSFFMGYHGDQYKLEFFTDDGSAILYGDREIDKRYTPGVWEHLVATYDGETAILYVNGEEFRSVALSGNLKIITDHPESIYNAFTLSGFYELRSPGDDGMPNTANSSGITDELDGRMDNFKLYNIALSGPEIQAIYDKEYKIVVEPDPCDDYYLVYEIGENLGSGSKEISIREGEDIRLTLNDETVSYVVRGPDEIEILDGLIENITVSGDYTVTAILDDLGIATGVKVIDFCSEQGSPKPSLAEHAVDENIKSYWHTLWDGDQDINEDPYLGEHLHYIDLDLGAATSMERLHYLPRPEDEQDEAEENLLNGTITKYNIYISNTLDASDEVVWDSIPTTTGEWDYNHELKTAELGGVVGRYIRLEAVETREGLIDESNISQWASAADITIEVPIECVQTLNIKVEPPTTYTFDGNWFDDADPSGISKEFDDINIVSGNATLTASTSAYNITVAPGAALIIGPDAKNVTIRNALTLNSEKNSYSTLYERGLLTGPVIYNRYVNKMGDNISGGGNDLISAPVAMSFNENFISANGELPQNPQKPGVYAFGPYNQTTKAYENFDMNNSNSQSIPVIQGKGYRAATTNGSTLRFRGKPTQNIVGIEVTAVPGESDWNLLGNPYPSYLDFEMFFEENKDQFEPDYQAIYGYTGKSGEWEIWNQTNIDELTEELLIAPGQGFFVKSRTGGGLVQFEPAMRYIGEEDPGGFIANRSVRKNLALSKLTMTRAANAVTTSVYFIEGTSRGLDPGYDAGVYGATSVNFSLFTNLLEDNTGRDMAIQSLPYEDFNDVSVPLGIKAKAGAELRIGIDELSTLPENINVYLEDTQNNTLTLLNGDDFTFTPTEDVNGAGRFNVHYSARTLSIADMDANNNLRIFTTETPKNVVISGQLTSATTAHLYDIQGRLVKSKTLDTFTTTNVIDVSSLNTGVYVLKLNNDHQFKTQKLVIK